MDLMGHEKRFSGLTKTPGNSWGSIRGAGGAAQNWSGTPTEGTEAAERANKKKRATTKKKFK